jgi:cell division protein FtsQ
VLGRSGQLGSTLVEIQFEPNGNLWLITSSLGKVRLGLPDGQLGRRLDMLSHLSSQLSSRVKGLKVQSIDLSDPDHPELGLPPKPRPGGPVGSGPGVD